jgi:DNA polymerase bacteriophage-type
MICLVVHTEKLGYRSWQPKDGFQPWLMALILDPDALFDAHNVAFEKSIWSYIMVAVHGFPEIPRRRWRDTMAVCAYKALPQSVEEVVQVLRLPYPKDMEGNRLTLSLSRPNKKGYYPERTPEVLERVMAYCQRDVEAQVAIRKRLGELPPEELEVWFFDQEINEHGIRLDMEFVRKALEIVAQASGPLTAEFRKLVVWEGQNLNPTQLDKFKKWLATKNVALPDLAKATVERVLGIKDEEADSETWDEWEAPAKIDPEARRALEIRYLLNSASIKKLFAMQRSITDDGTVKYTLAYHGTGPGRWAGRLIQPQNFPRGTVKYDGASDVAIEAMVATIMSGDAEVVEMMVGPAVETVASALRHAIISRPHHVLLSADYVQIQARVLLAVSGQHDKAKLLGDGHDVYCDMASKIYRRPIDKKHDPVERQLGKNSVLGLGFGMGWNKFKLKYGEGHEDDFLKSVVNVYRKEWAPCVPKMWYALADAAVRTVHHRKTSEAYGVEYRLEDGWLSARLPSGRKIWYWNPQATREVMPWAECVHCGLKNGEHSNQKHAFQGDDVRPAFTYQAKKMGQLKTIKAFGGLLTENVVMGIERDIIVAGMQACRREGFPIILTVHDEVLADVPEKQADLNRFEQCLLETPQWARQLQIPVAVEGWSGERYRK